MKSELNFLLMLGVMIPPAFTVWALQTGLGSSHEWAEWLQGIYFTSPITFINLAYFVFVDVMFWIIYMAQGSTWLIDPHWQVRAHNTQAQNKQTGMHTRRHTGTKPDAYALMQ